MLRLPEGTTLMTLPEALGFKENEALSELRVKIVAAYESDDQAYLALRLEYNTLGRAQVDLLRKQETTDEFTLAHIGLLIAEARISYEAGNQQNLEERLDDAAIMADQEGFPEVSALING